MSFDERMKEINSWAIPLEGTPERKRLEKRLAAEREQDPEIQKKIRSTIETAQALIFTQQNNGAGLPLDKTQREYNNEYNNRVFKYSLRHMPTSFNTMEAFNKFLPPTATFKLQKEKDYLLSFVDYIDFITSAETSILEQRIEDLTTEGIIYSYNGTHDPYELSFKCGGDEEFCVSGISMIRHGKELNIMMLAGMVCNLDEATASLSTDQIRSAPPHKVGMAPDPSLERKAVPLIEGTDLWRTIVHSRIDLESSSMDVRYVAQDWGDTFHICTDDISTFTDEKGNFLLPEYEDIAKKAIQNISKYQSLFEFIKACINIPVFTHYKDDLFRTERHPTKLKEIQTSTRARKALKLVPNSEKIFLREVLFLTSEDPHTTSRKTIYSPNIRIETSGFWKTLPMNSIGQDKAGQPIHGRTWVEKTLSWIEESTAVKPIHTRSHSPLKAGANPGFIYVMRCAAHGKDIFKIGLTKRTAELRAQELTGATASPDQFLVVEDWEVKDCELAERLIHERLSEYRVNAKREFFKARYIEIHKIVSETITYVDNLN